MSKAIVIKKDGVSQNLTVDKLRTNDADGQSIDWVPEDTVQLAVLNATANGTYTPTGGKYGYEYAAVSVPGSVVTGKKSDGDTYVYTKDGNGALVETKVPTEIRITTSPTKLVYADGEAIDITGAVVKAYFETGGEYGVVPIGEITLNPNKAVYDESTDQHQTITVLWPRPGDGAILETSFDIAVQQSLGGASGGGGEAGESGAGRND